MPNCIRVGHRILATMYAPHAVCITDDKVLEEIGRKETEKARVQLEREARKTERICRREEKQRKKKKKQSDTSCPANSKTTSISTISDDLGALELSSSKSDAICPTCGLSYSETGGLWVCCDSCNQWYNIECTNIYIKKKIPISYYCQECTGQK